MVGVFSIIFPYTFELFHFLAATPIPISFLSNILRIIYSCTHFSPLCCKWVNTLGITSVTSRVRKGSNVFSAHTAGGGWGGGGGGMGGAACLIVPPVTTASCCLSCYTKFTKRYCDQACHPLSPQRYRHPHRIRF